jgi:hypothetical protein
MKLRPKLITIIVFLLALAVFAAAVKIGHPGWSKTGFSSGG